MVPVGGPRNHNVVAVKVIQGKAKQGKTEAAALAGAAE